MKKSNIALLVSLSLNLTGCGGGSDTSHELPSEKPPVQTPDSPDEDKEIVDWVPILPPLIPDEKPDGEIDWKPLEPSLPVLPEAPGDDAIIPDNGLDTPVEPNPNNGLPNFGQDIPTWEPENNLPNFGQEGERPQRPMPNYPEGNLPEYGQDLDGEAGFGGVLDPNEHHGDAPDRPNMRPDGGFGQDLPIWSPIKPHPAPDLEGDELPEFDSEKEESNFRKFIDFAAEHLNYNWSSMYRLCISGDYQCTMVGKDFVVSDVEHNSHHFIKKGYVVSSSTIDFIDDIVSARYAFGNESVISNGHSIVYNNWYLEDGNLITSNVTKVNKRTIVELPNNQGSDIQPHFDVKTTGDWKRVSTYESISDGFLFYGSPDQIIRDLISIDYSD